jgi:hypothetical protein
MPGSGFAFRQKFEERRWSNPDKTGQYGNASSSYKKPQLLESLPWTGWSSCSELATLIFGSSILQQKENGKLDACKRQPTSSAIDAIKKFELPMETFVSTRI